MAQAEIDLANAQPGQEQEDFERWDFGHLIRECNRCGHRTIMDRDVQDGVSMYFPTTDKHELRLTCEKCDTSMRMFWIKSDKVKPPKEPIEEKPEEVVEEKRKRKRVKKDAVSKNSKKEKSVQTDIKSS